MAVTGKCLALYPDGSPCLEPALPWLPYCAPHATLHQVDPRLVRRALRRAIARPESYLAAALAEVPDDDLAAVIGADPRRVWLLRLADWPRLEHWAGDLDQLAGLVGADGSLLAVYLQERGITAG
jgi:hypothetical protein